MTVMTSKQSLLIIEDDDSMRWVLEKTMSKAGYEIFAINDTRQASSLISKNNIQVVISDIKMPGEDGLSFVERITSENDRLAVILMTAHSDLETAVNVYEKGAFDYLPKPFDLNEAVQMVARAFESLQLTDHVQASRRKNENGLIGEASAMQVVFKAIGKLARTEVTVLITGESGTGKELVARALHENSPRKQGNFVAINMAAIPAELIESELFGHEKGAFTGATEKHQGWFEQAHQGTLFLDEIGDMPQSAQTRLLRVLSEGKFYRVGGKTALKSAVRIIAATHQPLLELVQQGVFRDDLYHRLNVVKIAIPSLRDRATDIPLLMDYFLDRVAVDMSISRKKIKPELKDFLMNQPWPGNVRELENLCRWLTVMTSGTQLGIEDLPSEFRKNGYKKIQWQQSYKNWLEQKLQTGDINSIQQSQKKFEKILLDTVLNFHQGHRQKAADTLGWGRNTVTRKLKSNT